MKKQKQAGFAAIEVIMIIIVLIVLGAIGFYVQHRHAEDNQPRVVPDVINTSTKPPSSGTAVPSAPQIQNAADLNKAAQALDQTDMTASTSDSSQLSTQASGL